jgi:hypothetical protein
MGGFRTRGWFGPQCPTLGSLYFDDFNIHDFSDPSPAPQPIGGRVNFPLDIAMKIFWEAQSFQINSFIEATVNGETKSDTKNITIPWGAFVTASFQQGDFQRQSVETAKEMLCILQNPSSSIASWHTFSTSFLNSPLPATWYSFFLLNPSISTFPAAIDLLIFEMEWRHDITLLFGSQFQQIVITAGSTRPNIGPVNIGSWNLNTPWGNFSLPLWGSGGRVVDASVTITVTAADPAVRYA